LKKYNNYYSEFNFWYWNKFIPSLYYESGKLITIKKRDEILEVSLLKKIKNRK